MTRDAPATLRQTAATDAVSIAVEPGFDFTSVEYRALYERARCSAFQHPDWMAAFYRRLVGAAGTESLIVVVRDGTGAPLLVLPLIRRAAGGAVAIEHASLGVTDYACVVAAPELRLDDEIVSAVRVALGRYDTLRVAPVRDEDCGAWRALLDLPPELLPFSAHAAACEGPYADWRRQTLGATRLAGLERKARRLADLGPVRLRIAEAAEAADAIEAASRFRIGRFTEDPLQDARFRAFYAEVATRGAVTGSSRTYLLTCAADLVAVLFGLVHGARFCYLLLGCDYGRFERHSPGMIMFDRAMADWFGGGGQVFDFTIGDEAFKAGFGSAPTRMHGFARNRPAFA